LRGTKAHPETWRVLHMRAVYTIGYEGTAVDALITALRAAGVRVLADVRAVPVSRKRGFSKSALAKRLGEEGITYAHFAELGDPKPGRDAARAGRYERFHQIYSTHLRKTKAQAALRTLAEVAQRAPTCLLCFERHSQHCHRAIVARSLRGFDVIDLHPAVTASTARNASEYASRHAREGLAQPEQEIR